MTNNPNTYPGVRLGLASNAIRSIPQQWSAPWFRRFISDHLQNSDVRNAIGVNGITVGGTPTTKGTLTLGGIPLASLAPQSPFTVVANDTGATASPTAISEAQLTSMVQTFTASLNGSAPASGGGTINYLNAAGSWTTVPPSSISPIGNDTVLGNVSGGSAAPIALSQLQLTALVNVFTSSLSGAVSASGGGTLNFARADGTWAVPPGTGGSSANPSAVVGLTVVDGTATTFMTSDSAPPLSQAIVPTWTGVHTWTPASGAGIVINAVSGTGGEQIIGAANSFASLILKSGQTGTRSFELISGLAADDFDIYDDTLGAPRFEIQAANNKTLAYGPTAAALVDMTPDKGSFTGTITGCTVAPTPTVSWSKQGNHITLTFPNASTAAGASNTTACTMTGLPAALQPARTQFVPCALQNNSVDGIGAALITASSGTITFYWSVSALSPTGFTASGGKGCDDTTFTYQLV